MLSVLRKNVLASCRDPAWWLGVILAGVLAVIGIGVADMAWAQQWGLSALTIAIVVGMAAGNTFFPAIASRAGTGVDFSRNRLLRAGIILYGFRITFQQITAIGWVGLAIDALVVSLTFLLAVQLGTRVFKMDRQMSMLIGSGASICGAAAVLATEPVLKAPSHKVSVAVATVVVFGTVGMFVYPLLYPYLGLSEFTYGIYAGSTIHEVAQVVVAGRSVGEVAAATAVIEKMIRVMLLAPFLIVLSMLLRKAGGNLVDAALQKRPIVIPWFAIGFIAASVANSFQLFSPAFVDGLVAVDNVLLAMAMAALGMRTHASAIRQAGSKPLLLAALLFIFLVAGGYAINRVVMAICF